jgi:hypothetical protein
MGADFVALHETGKPHHIRADDSGKSTVNPLFHQRASSTPSGRAHEISKPKNSINATSWPYFSDKNK